MRSCLILALLGLAACGHGGAQPNILLIVLDTVRTDHLSCHGYERNTSPTIDRLAQSGVQFRRAQSISPWTIPALASLWTGVSPSVHLAGMPDEMKLSKQFVFRGFAENAFSTLPQRLHDLGYTAFAYFANPLLGMPCFLNGFDPAHAIAERVPAAKVIDAALQWLPELERAEPFFLYLHFMDSHELVEPPDAYRDQFATDHVDRSASRFAGWGPYGDPSRVKDAEFASFRANKIAVYDGSLRYIDDELGRLLTAMRERGLLEQTYVIVTADHGEEFWDHQQDEARYYQGDVRPHLGIGHGHAQFQELLHVPLVVSGPGLAPRQISTRVSTLDLGATILALAKADENQSFGQSSSMVPLLTGAAEPPRAVFAEGTSYGYELKAVVDEHDYKLIASVYPKEKSLLFDLGADPGERHDIIQQHPEIARRLGAEINRWVQSAIQRQAKPGTSSSVAPTQLDQLGYTAPKRK